MPKPTNPDTTHVPLVDICLVTRVAQSLEAVLQQQWGLGGQDLHDAIRALPGLGVPNRTVAAAHALRMQRNRVLHHPGRPLKDREAFVALGREVLEALQRTPQAVPAPALPTSASALVLDDLRRQNQARLEAIGERSRTMLASMARATAR